MAMGDPPPFLPWNDATGHLPFYGEMPEHIRKRHARDIPSLGSLDDIKLPAAPVRLEVSEIVDKQAVLDNSAKLEELTEKALRFYDDLLSEPADIDGGNKGLLSAQMDAARTVVTTQLRVDDSRLKKRSVDTLAKLLARMSEEEGKIMKTIDA